MANDIKGNPWLIDTAEAITTDPFRVMLFLYKPAAASDQCVLKDKTGRTILDVKANASTAELQIQIDPHDARFMGCTCTTLTANSKLYVYLNPTCS